MSITTDNLAEFVDRLADLKRALAQLNDAGTADRHLIGLETVANAARALFDDDKQTTALRLFANPSSNADMEPMLETGNGGYAYMDELAKYRIYGPLVQLACEELSASVWLCGFASKAGTRLLRAPRSQSLHR